MIVSVSFDAVHRLLSNIYNMSDRPASVYTETSALYEYLYNDTERIRIL